MLRYLTANAARLRVGEAQVAEFTRLVQAFLAAFAVYEDPATHTETAVHTVRAAYGLADRYARGLRRQIEADMTVVKTGADDENLYLPRRKKAVAHIHPAEISPVNLLEESRRTHLRAVVRTADPTNEHTLHRLAKPAGVRAIGRKMAITDSPTPPAEAAHADYALLNSVGRARHHLDFASADVGKYAHLITWYINPRGETGTASMPLSFLVV